MGLTAGPSMVAAVGGRAVDELLVRPHPRLLQIWLFLAQTPPPRWRWSKCLTRGFKMAVLRPMGDVTVACHLDGCRNRQLLSLTRAYNPDQHDMG